MRGECSYRWVSTTPSPVCGRAPAGRTTGHGAGTRGQTFRPPTRYGTVEIARYTVASNSNTFEKCILVQFSRVTVL